MALRRELLTALPVMALAATSANAATPAKAAASCGGISRQEFDRYVTLYNAADPAFIEYYQPDVVMELNPPLRSAAAIGQFRRELAVYVLEHITVEYFVSDENGAAAQFLGEFKCVRDMPITALGGLFGKAVKKDQVLKQRGVILYGVKDKKFTFVRASPPIILQDWS